MIEVLPDECFRATLPDGTVVFAVDLDRIAVLFDAQGETTPEPTVWQAPPTPPPALTPRQMRLMMLQIGMAEADVVAAIEAIGDPAQRAAALIEWTWATRIDRNHPLVVMLAEALSFDPAQLDDLWAYAATI